MRRILLLILLLGVPSAIAFPHSPFTLVSSESKTVRETELGDLKKKQTIGLRSGSTLTFTQTEINLVIITGPEDDMLSYDVQGIRNPTIVVPPAATLWILFVNIDFDMRHDIRFGHVTGDLQIAPELAETVGSLRLTARSEDGMLQAESIVIKANETGAYKYFCSVRGHAKGGMWGNIFVGIKPGSDTKLPEKTEHIHSPDEDNDDRDHPSPKPSPSPGTESPAGQVQKPQRQGEQQVAGHQHVSAIPASDHSGHARDMRSSVNIGEPMARGGSGTSWVPDSSPQYAYMKMFNDGSMLMLHGVGFLRYTSVGSRRDVSIAGKGSRRRFDAPTMFMAMYSKPLSKNSQLGVRTMFSLDPAIERGWGYPLLFQSGETYGGEPIHDRQHPHDMITELALTYSHKFDENNSVYIYAGLPGEPALGPPMYLHRLSGMNIPDAPIGHHWQDATHITFGVLTAGFSHRSVKFEASAFNGTEPDENRWTIDRPKLDSFSGRVSFNPSKELSFQISYGYIRSPERAEPELKILRRMTASAIYNRSFNENENWASAFVWGQNHTDDGRTNSFLFESNYEFHKNSIFGRAEQVQKSAHELALASPHPEGDFWVQAYSIGYLRDIVKDKGIDVGIGGMATFNANPSAIASYYGGTSHAGGQLYVRIRPSRIK